MTASDPPSNGARRIAPLVSAALSALVVLGGASAGVVRAYVDLQDRIRAGEVERVDLRAQLGKLQEQLALRVSTADKDHTSYAAGVEMCRSKLADHEARIVRIESRNR